METNRLRIDMDVRTRQAPPANEHDRIALVMQAARLQHDFPRVFAEREAEESHGTGPAKTLTLMLLQCMQTERVLLRQLRNVEASLGNGQPWCPRLLLHEAQPHPAAGRVPD